MTHTTVSAMAKVTTFHYRGESFLVVKDNEGAYWGINTKDVTDGKLTKELNGISGNRSRDIKGVLESIMNVLDMRYMTDLGFEMEQILLGVVNGEYREYK